MLIPFISLEKFLLLNYLSIILKRFYSYYIYNNLKFFELFKNCHIFITLAKKLVKL